MSIRMRVATPADAAGCLAIYRPFVESTPVTFERTVPSVDEFAGRMAEVLKRHPWLVCEEQDRIQGYVYATYYRPRPAYQWGLETTVYLAPDARGQGVATVLYRNLLECLRRQGIVNAYAAITLPNDASVALHERLGFLFLGQYDATGYKLGAWHTVGWWQLRLSPLPDQPREPIPFPDLEPPPELRQLKR